MTFRGTDSEKAGPGLQKMSLEDFALPLMK